MFFLPTLLKGIATGAGLFSQFGAAKQREETAALNFRINSQNAALQSQQTIQGLQFQSLGNLLELNTVRANASLAMNDVAMRERNAERLRQFAESRTDDSREAIRRQKRAFEAMQGTQQASIGASGVEISGSPLDVMAETAGQMQIALQDMLDDANFERSEGLNQAGIERFGAAQQRAGIKAGVGFAKVKYGIDRASTRLGRISADMQYNSTMFGAAMGQMQQEQAAQGQRMGAIGGIFSGAANLYSSIK